MSQWKRLAEGISYLPFSVSPLSADVFRIQGEQNTWLFDVGAATEAVEQIAQIPGKTAVVLSHFHPDHTANLDNLQPDALYLGAYTFEKTGRGTVIDKPVLIEDGRTFRLFPLPSTHAKGSIGLEVDETYAFVGDAVYSSAKNGRIYYNATLLLDTIRCLHQLKAPWFVLSHAQPVLQRREDVLAMLEGIYQQRNPSCPEIYPR